MTKKLLAILALILSLGLALGGVMAVAEEMSGKVVNEELTGEITQWSWNDYDRDGASMFNDYYPNVKVNYEIVADYETKFRTVLAAGGDLPDVFDVEEAHRASFYSQDIWEILDEPPYNLDRSLLVDFSIPLISNPQGQIVGVQIDNCVGGYAYRRELAKEFFGTDDPAELEAIFQTPQDYIDKAKEVSEKSGGSVYMFSSLGDAFRAFSSLGQSNKEPLAIDGKLNIRAAYTETFTIIEELIKVGAIGPYVGWTPAWNTSFSSNEVIFFPGPTWFLSVCIKANDPDSLGDYGVMNPPGGSFSWGGTAYSIPKGAKNKELAWEYIKWLAVSQGGAESFYKAHGTATLYQPAYDTDLYKNDPDPYFGGQAVMEKYLAISQNPDTMVRPMTVYDATIGRGVGLALDQMLENGMSAEDALTMAEDEALVLDPALSR